MRTNKEVKEAIEELVSMRNMAINKKDKDYFQGKIDSLEWVLETTDLF